MECSKPKNRIVLYHVTPFRNIPSIRAFGLSAYWSAFEEKSISACSKNFLSRYILKVSHFQETKIDDLVVIRFYARRAKFARPHRGLYIGKTIVFPWDFIDITPAHILLAC